MNWVVEIIFWLKLRGFVLIGKFYGCWKNGYFVGRIFDVFKMVEDVLFLKGWI